MIEFTFRNMNWKNLHRMLAQEPTWKRMMDTGYVIEKIGRTGNITFAFPKELVVDAGEADPRNFLGRELKSEDEFLKTRIFLSMNGHVKTYFKSVGFTSGTSKAVGSFDHETNDGWLLALSMVEHKMNFFLDKLEIGKARALRTPELRHEKRGLLVSNKFGF